MDIVICAGRVGKHVERKCAGEILVSIKKGIWWRRGEIDKGGRIKKTKTGRKDDERVCPTVQEGGKRKRIQRETIGGRV